MANRVAYWKAVAIAAYLLVVVLALFTQPVGEAAFWILCGLVGWAAARWGYPKVFEWLMKRFTRS